jgi:nucleoside phosphorylase
MKLLTFAHRGEAQAFLSAYSFRPCEFVFDGLLKSDDYYLLITGEGPQPTSEKTITVLAKLSDEITHVINLGVAGSLNPKHKLHDLVWVRTAYAHHAEKLEFKSFTSTSANATNDCMTAYTRVLDENEKKKLSQFASLVDRELWAVASAATLFKKPYTSLKIISDEMKAPEGDICKFIKTEAPLFSEKLLEEFQRSEGRPAITKEKTRPQGFLHDPLFYFTTSQERKLESTLEGLKLKGVSLDSLLNDPEVIAIKEQDKLPKERTRLLLLFLGAKLNPISLKILAAIEDSIEPLTDAKISVNFDNEFEEDWLNLSIKIQSTRDLERVKNALKIFSYEDYKKIFEGHFDV